MPDLYADNYADEPRSTGYPPREFETFSEYARRECDQRRTEMSCTPGSWDRTGADILSLPEAWPKGGIGA